MPSTPDRTASAASPQFGHVDRVLLAAWLLVGFYLAAFWTAVAFMLVRWT